MNEKEIAKYMEENWDGAVVVIVTKTSHSVLRCKVDNDGIRTEAEGEATPGDFIIASKILQEMSDNILQKAIKEVEGDEGK